MDFVYDRVQNDVTYVKTLIAKGWVAMTTTEKAYFLADTVKGAYNYTDFNRVEDNTDEINTSLTSIGFTITLDTKVGSWVITDIPTITETTRILNNIQLMITAYYTYVTTPTLPSDMQNMTFTEANAIEKILFDINSIVLLAIDSFKYCGTFNCGQTSFL